jgi:hypothetical protein
MTEVSLQTVTELKTLACQIKDTQAYLDYALCRFYVSLSTDHGIIPPYVTGVRTIYKFC